MKCKHFILFFIYIISCFPMNAGMGSWQTYLSYADVQVVAQSSNKVFAVSSGALFSYNKHDSSVEIYSKLTGLSDSDISYIDYSNEDEILFIVYQNSNIDLLTSGGIYNLPDLKNKTITGSKVINSVSFKDGFAYLATDFGVSKVNLKKKEFADTYIIGDNGTNLAVNSAFIHNDSIYACTENSMLAAGLNKNLSDYHNWVSSSMPDYSVKNVKAVTFEDKVYLLKEGGGVYIKTEQIWSFLDGNILSINLSWGKLNLTKQNEIISLFNNTSVSFAIPDSSPMGIYDGTKIYFAAQKEGIGVLDTESREMSFYKPDGPAINDPFIMRFADGRLYVITSGTHTSDNRNEVIPAAVMIYDGNSWLNFTKDNITKGKETFYSTRNIAIDPTDSKHFYVSTFYQGVYEFRDNQFYEHYNNTNSSIDWNNGGYQVVDGVAFDKKGNLWMVQTVVMNSVLVQKSDGTWKSFYFQDLSQKANLQGTLIDENNYKWINLPRTIPGIFIFNDNGTIDDTSDDNHKFYSSFIDQDGNLITPTEYRHIVEDKSESKKIWIGTSNGPIIISNPKNIFNSNAITRIKIPRNDGSNLADYLLENETVNWIAVDGANRKWLATKNSGVYLVSENGTETIYHFTTENSPLLSDNVYSVAIDPETGEVFFATTKGLVSFMGDATEGKKSFSNAYAYPNPVREDYYGVITIAGLMEKTNVKITDVAGNLIYETTSNGGSATWDGTNITGQRVSTGVYLALCSTPDASERTVVKILVINH